MWLTLLMQLNWKNFVIVLGKQAGVDAIFGASIALHHEVAKAHVIINSTAQKKSHPILNTLKSPLKSKLLNTL